MEAAWFRPRIWQLAHHRSLVLGPKALIMGVLNVTPDSFSDGGDFVDPDAALDRANAMLEQGATIIDVGGESTRPGAEAVDGQLERKRILPIIDRLAKQGRAIISVDTFRAKTAREAIAAGAHIVNDVWGCQREPDIAAIAAETGAGLVMMHTNREREPLDDVIEDQNFFLNKSLSIARDAGVRDENVILDPGFGFGKETVQMNAQLLNRLNQLHALEAPLLVGTSRKRFLGAMTGRDVNERGVATAATSVVARMKGAAIFRVHDIVENRDALAVADALIDAHFQD